MLPLEGGADEALERYRTFKAAGQACRKYGPERQANTRAALQAGLANLAQTAGFQDLSRLEWSMEARVSSQAGLFGASVAIGEYQASLEMEGLVPRLVVRRGERSLASVPSAIRKDSRWLALREGVDEIKAQAARFRRSVEHMMIDGRTLRTADLPDVLKLPVMRALLSGLVLRLSDGAYGTLSVEDHSLLDQQGASLPLGEDLAIAHPVDLGRGGVLKAWQQEAVRRGLVQPFKQVFREVYLPTEGEAEAACSRRFAGQALSSRVASRLLQSRGWESGAADEATPFKRHRAAGIRAWFEFPNAGHFLAEEENVTSGEVYFTRDDEPYWLRTRLPLAEVPLVVLSETMRDADLVVSVARSDSDALSSEAYERRGEAVVAIAAELGAGNVSREGRFVHVRGELARYRIHLGSGTVQVEPSNAVCIIPASRQNADILLPFADEDEVMTEIVSKVMLLSRDALIRDEQLLAQIRVATES